MKKLITLSAPLFASLLFTTTSFAQGGEQIKEQTLQICITQAQQLEESQQELAIKTCECTSNNTDYDAFLVDMAAGNIAKLQAEAAVVTQKCSVELGAE